jgi:hypothetical protein
LSSLCFFFSFFRLLPWGIMGLGRVLQAHMPLVIVCCLQLPSEKAALFYPPNLLRVKWRQIAKGASYLRVWMCWVDSLKTNLRQRSLVQAWWLMWHHCLLLITKRWKMQQIHTFACQQGISSPWTPLVSVFDFFLGLPL